MRNLSIKTLVVLAVVAGAIFFSINNSSVSEIITSQTPIPAVGEFGGPGRVLNAAETAKWLSGRAIFDHDFHESEGLGTPDFNADSCRACHRDPAIGGSGGLELNVLRYGVDGGVQANFMNLPNGQVASKFRLPGMGRDEVDAGADVFEQRQTPSIFGLGRIDLIPDANILANEDPTDADGNGIFGVAHMITVGGGGLEVGRFGWKAQLPRLSDFLNDAMAGENGLTTHDNGRGFNLATDNDGVADPDLSPSDFDDCLFFMAELAAPKRGGSTHPDIAIGQSVFNSVGCANCHRPSLDDVNGDPVPLYSDLLLHNVMSPSFHGVVQGQAGVGFFRTPPLWGISHTAPYFHDGRAETLLDAILTHEGEATEVVVNFQVLPPAHQQALITFLNDL